MATHTEHPPSYEEALAAAEKLQKNPPSAEKLANAHKLMAEKAAAPETRSTLLSEVKKLSGAAREISIIFGKIGRTLGNVDKRKLKTKDDRPIILQPGWLKLEERFNKLYYISKSSATETEAYMDQFCSRVSVVMDPKATYTLDERKRTLESLVNKTPKDPEIRRTITDAEQYSKQFKELRQDVLDYSKRFDGFADDAIAKLNGQIEKLKDQIKTLEEKIKEQEAVIFKTGIAMGATAFGVGLNAVGALVAMGPAGPVAAIGIVITGLVGLAAEAATLISYIRDRNVNREELGKLQAELTKKTNELEDLVQLRARLEECKEGVNTIAARLDQFSLVWGLVANDAKQILEHFKEAKEVPTQPEFVEKTKLMIAAYRSLAEAMGEYAKLNSDLPNH